MVIDHFLISLVWIPGTIWWFVAFYHWIIVTGASLRGIIFIIIIIDSNTFDIPFAAEILDAETVAVVAVVVVVVVAAVAEATLTHTFCGNLVTMKAN